MSVFARPARAGVGVVRREGDLVVVQMKVKAGREVVDGIQIEVGSFTAAERIDSATCL